MKMMKWWVMKYYILKINKVKRNLHNKISTLAKSLDYYYWKRFKKINLISKSKEIRKTKKITFTNNLLSKIITNNINLFKIYKIVTLLKIICINNRYQTIIITPCTLWKVIQKVQVTLTSIQKCLSNQIKFKNNLIFKMKFVMNLYQWVF